MSISLRLILGYFLILAFAAWLLLQSFMETFSPSMRQSLEEVLVESANLLAEQLVGELRAGELVGSEFDQAMRRFGARQFQALIRGREKQQPQMILYITDHRGVVLYHTDAREVGADYSRWNDVYLTLQGHYGARTTRRVADQPFTSTMYVAAPMLRDGELLGVLTLGMPSVTIAPIISAARAELQREGLWLLLVALGLGVALTYGLTRSIRRLTRYASEVKSGNRVAMPQLEQRELQQLAEAMEGMRRELEGRDYVEHYLHSLTHELKSPLAAISGAAELLGEEGLPVEQRQRFATNVRQESERLNQIVERLLSLAVVEKRQSLEERCVLQPDQLVERLAEDKQVLLEVRQGRFSFELQAGTARVLGDAFLLTQALSNLLDNAIDFTPEGGTVRLLSQCSGGEWTLLVIDQGPGLPDYALERVFERFYALQQPGRERRGVGLGLSLVREVVLLHGGTASLENADGGGALARLSLPLMSG